MAKQRYNIGVNSLAYDDPTKGTYVAPPTKEILAFRGQRKNDYLTTKNNINLEQELAKTIKSIPQSKGVYDELITTIDSTLAGITPDNYADKTLDSNQLIHDTIYKFGGKELEDQYNDYQAKSKAIAETKNVRPEKAEWYQAKLAQGLQGITKDATGKFVIPSLATPKVVPEQDIFAKTQAILKDFKSSAFYNHDATTGKITIDKELAGRFGITKTEFANEKELYDTALSIVGTDGTNREYIENEAEFSTYKRPPTVESVTQDLRNLPDAQFNMLFPDKKPEQITTDDIISLTGNNPEALKELAKQSFTINYMNSVGQSMANIYGFKKEDKTFFEDVNYMEEAKARWSNKTKGGDGINDDEPANPMVLVKPATTFTIASPVIYDNYKVNEEKSITEYVEAKKEYTTLMAEVDKDKTQEPRLRELIREKKEMLEKADADIQSIRQAKESLTKSTIQIAKNKGIPVEQFYGENLKTIQEDVSNSNANNLAFHGYTADVSAYVKENPNKENYAKVDIKGLENKDIPIYSDAYVASRKGFGLDDNYLTKKGGTYIFHRTKGNSPYETNKDILNKVPVDKIKSNNTNTKFSRVPTIDEFNEITSKFFMKSKDLKTNAFGTITNEVDGLSLKTVALARNLATKMSKEFKPSDVNVNQTLDYLYVDDQIKKGTAAYDLLRLGVSIDTTLQADANQYKVVNDSGQWEDLPLYLRSKGLSINDIDFSKLKTSVMLTSDREYGQKLNMPLPLTENGKKVLLDNGSEALALSGTLNVTAVSATGKNSSFNKKLVDTVYRAYKESFNNTLPSGDQERKAYGLVAFDNSQYSQNFYKLNLYTMGDGGSATYTTPDNNKLVINAIKRTATPGRLGDNDFYLTQPDGAIMATDRQSGATAFVSKSAYDADVSGAKYRRTMFASPEDIGSLIGQNFMNIQARNNNTSSLQNNQVKTTGGNYEVGQDRVISTTHSTTTSTTIKTYGRGSAPRVIKDDTGKEVSVNSKINPKDMTYLKDTFPDQFKKGVFPYINNSAVSAVNTLMKDYNLYITDMYRAAGSSTKRKEGAKDSLHEYGKSLDARYNADSQRLLAELQSNPEMAQNLGISYAFKHVVDGTPHLHIDFN